MVNERVIRKIAFVGGFTKLNQCPKYFQKKYFQFFHETTLYYDEKVKIRKSITLCVLYPYER